MLHACRRNFCGDSEQRHDFLLRASVSTFVCCAKMRLSDEISTVCINDQGNKRSGAINCATVSRSRLSGAVDKMNQKFGKNSVFLASLEKAKDKADEKIAFNKTWLFSEGKDDNEWPDTFRGNPRE